LGTGNSFAAAATFDKTRRPVKQNSNPERSANMNEPIAMGSLGELRSALDVLVKSHTRDDRGTGFVVESSRDPLRDQGEYIHAWAVVRQAMGYQVDPALNKSR
jgi:hypothetical protein